MNNRRKTKDHGMCDDDDMRHDYYTPPVLYHSNPIVSYLSRDTNSNLSSLVLVFKFTMASISSSPWAYFVAGALLPTLAVFLLRRPNFLSATGDNDNDSDSDDDEDMEDLTSGGPSSKWGRLDAPYKMVLCVNQELTMGKGKVAAQCCHAAVGCYKRASKQCPAALRAWEVSGCAKIALKCPTQDELELIAAKAMERDIPLYLVEDAGRTQIAAGSRTVLGLGPAPAYVFEDVTSHLKLM